MADPYTLRIFVPSGDPEGVRIIDRMNWTGRAIALPRDNWDEVKGRAELQRAGVYVLSAYEDDDLGNERIAAYIGQTDTLANRIESHLANKEWWERVVLFFSANDGLNRAHTTWIEWDLIRRATDAKVCRLENRVEPSEPTLIESEKADTRAFVQEMLRVAPIAGLHIFASAKPARRRGPTSATSMQASDSKDTIIVPAQREGFRSAFLGENAWWAIRIADRYMDALKWIAAYQVLPIAAITHIAEIDRFEPYGDAGKWKVYFKGPAKELPRPVPFGDAVTGSIQGPRYTTYKALTQAKSLRELLQQDRPEEAKISS